MTFISKIDSLSCLQSSFQQHSLLRFSYEFQALLEPLIRFSNPDSFAIVSTIVAISSGCSGVSLSTQEFIFTQLLKEIQSHSLSFLRRLKKIAQQTWADAFFSCATSKKVIGYSLSTLENILTDFEVLIRSINFPYSPPTDFPCYDEDGEYLLSQLKQNPDFLLKLSQKEQKELVSSAFLHDDIPTQNRCELLSNSHSFLKAKSIAIAYLSSLPDRARSKIEIYIKIFRWLEKDGEARIFSEQVKVTLVQLIIKISSCEVAEQLRKITILDGPIHPHRLQFDSPT